MSNGAWWFLWLGLPIAVVIEMFVVALIMCLTGEKIEAEEEKARKARIYNRNKVKWEAANPGYKYDPFTRGQYQGYGNIIPVELEEN